MASIIASGKYKLVETIESSEGYSAHKGIDIQSKGNPAVLVNRYSSADAIKGVVAQLHRLTPETMEGFISLSVQEEELYAIFDFPPGKPLMRVFGNKTYPEREEAYALAEDILHRLLLLSSLPPVFMNAASDPSNILVHREGKKCFSRMLITPLTSHDPSTSMFNISECMELIFKRRFSLMDFELDFLDELRCEGYDSLSALYAAWRDVERRWEEERSGYEKMLPVKRFMHLAMQKWKRRRRAKEYRNRLEAMDRMAERDKTVNPGSIY